MGIEKRCSICGRLCGERVHNVFPYKKSGMCCDTCNQEYIIPAKIKYEEMERRRRKRR